jgi:hypothetical protein
MLTGSEFGLGKENNRLIIAFGLICLVCAAQAIAYSGSDTFGLDFVLTKIDDLLGGAAGVLLAIFLVATAVVLFMRNMHLMAAITVICTFILIGIVGVAKKISGLVI